MKDLKEIRVLNASLTTEKDSYLVTAKDLIAKRDKLEKEKTTNIATFL